MGDDGRRKVAVLGGGVGAIVAAFELATAPGAPCDITVYQPGWRLGGKGASGRNAMQANRIEEHGAHAWFGFYENAFEVMGRAYRDLDRRADEPLSGLWDAFKPHTEFTFGEQRDGRWSDWPINLPIQQCRGKPGDGEPPLDGVALLLGLVNRLSSYLRANLEHPAIKQAVSGHPRGEWLLQASRLRWEWLALTVLRSWFHDQWTPHLRAETLRDVIGEALRANGLLSADGDQHVRRFWILLDVGLTVMHGLIKDGVLLHGFDSINTRDFEEWLEHHGLSQEARWSPPIRMAYESLFAYRQGKADYEHRAIAAGTAARGFLRLFLDYKEAACYEMQAGMGDVVFAPFYEVLRNKYGVKFRFFHRVDRLVPSDDGRSVERIEMTRQVRLKNREEYLPLVQVERLPCWPSLPDVDQIEDGDQLRRLLKQGLDFERRESPGWDTWAEPGAGHVEALVLHRGAEFDDVVLGISVGELRHLTDALTTAPVPEETASRWRAMLAIPTVATQSFQFWLRPDLRQLGWNSAHGEGRGRQESPIAAVYREPMSTWADFSHLLARESWPREQGSQPQSLAYLFGVTPDDTQKGPRDYADDFARNGTAWLWPEVSDERRGLDRGQLTALESMPAAPGRFGYVSRADQQTLFDSQWYRKNDVGSERYVLSDPGSIGSRMRAGETGFTNLVVAGDWTKTGLDVGCVEAAVMSGKQAARALCGFPRAVPGEHDSLTLGAQLLSVLRQWFRDPIGRIRRLWRLFRCLVGGH